MRIALVHSSLAVSGGAENLIMWLARGLARRGHAVTLITPAYDPALWEEMAHPRVAVHVLRTPATAKVLRSRVLAAAAYSTELAGLFRRFDVVNPHGARSCRWAAAARGRADAAPSIVWYCHEPSRRLYLNTTDRHLMNAEQEAGAHAEQNRHLIDAAHKLRKKSARWLKRRKRQRDRRGDRRAIGDLDRILANSRFTRDNLAAIFGIDAEVCYPGAPPAEAEGQAGATRERRGSRAASFATFGSLAPKKNLMNVLEALRILVKEEGVEQVTLEVVGRPAARDLVQAFAARHGIEDHVRLLGWVDDRELRRHYARATATVYVPIDEPFGLIPVESMAVGTPPVVTDHGGPAEVVEHGRTGLQVNPFDPGAIAGAMATLLRQDALRRALGEEGREVVRQRFTLDRFLDRYESCVLGSAR